MAFISTHASTGATVSLSSLFRGLVQGARETIAVQRTRSRLRWELNQCSDRELADMGVSRADIDAIVAGHLGSPIDRAATAR